MSSYYLDLSKISLVAFQQELATGELMSGRRVLKEEIDDRFDILENTGITTLQDLVSAVSTKNKTESLATQTGIPLEYLVVLGREARSRVPKPVALAKIPGSSPDEITILAANGIKNTKQLFDQAAEKANRVHLARQTGLPEPVLLSWARLADFARINGVGPVFIRILAETGIPSLDALAKMDAEKLFNEVKITYYHLGYTNANFTVKDMAMCIEIAAQLPHTLEE